MNFHYLRDVLEFSDCIGIADECQAGSSRDDVCHVFPGFVSQITQNGEDGYAGKETSEGIH